MRTVDLSDVRFLRGKIAVGGTPWVRRGAHVEGATVKKIERSGNGNRLEGGETF